MQSLMMMIVVALIGAAAPQGQDRPLRSVTLKGCVARTAAPGEFLLTVPGQVGAGVRGIAEGEPVPPGAGAGPAPRSNPLANPPVGASGQGLPEGRYSTPTVVNHTFRLQGLDVAQLEARVGQAIEVVGRVEVGGFPSGDAPADHSQAGTPSPMGPVLHGDSFTPVADSCVALIQQQR